MTEPEYPDFPTFEASLYERQIAVAMLAHAARRDATAIQASLASLVDAADELRPVHVIGALLEEFQKGMDDMDSDELANWFAGAAQVFAARHSEGDRI